MIEGERERGRGRGRAVNKMEEDRDKNSSMCWSMSQIGSSLSKMQTARNVEFNSC